MDEFSENSPVKTKYGDLVTGTITVLKVLRPHRINWHPSDPQVRWWWWWWWTGGGGGGGGGENKWPSQWTLVIT